MKFLARRRQPRALPGLPPLPLNALGRALQAADRRGDELLGLALDERSRLSHWLAIPTISVLHWLHPEWRCRALAASIFKQ